MAEGLHDTVQSILAQTYPSIELIVVDGGSSDGTLDYLFQEGNIDQFVSEPDRGQFDAINKGLRKAHGAYVCVLNAKDTYTPEAIARMVEVAKNQPGAIIYSDYRYAGKDIFPPDRITPAFNLYNIEVAHQTLLVPRELYTGAIGAYRTDFKIVADHIWMRAAYRQGINFSKLHFSTLEFDGTGISAVNKTLFKEEFSRRTTLYYPSIPIEVASQVFEFIHLGQSSHDVLKWVAAQKDYGATLEVKEFEESIEDCLRIRSYSNIVKLADELQREQT